MSFNENTLRTDRIQESLASQLLPLSHLDQKILDQLLLLSPADQGVIRNLGRAGARFAPDAIVCQLKKMAATKTNNKIFYKNILSDSSNFDSSQTETSKIISSLLDLSPKGIIHLGGGHDHIYPLLNAIDDKYKKIHILNVDAHLDMRQDDHHHSGTPFRQFIKESKSQYKILQTGIHKFANSKKTKAELGNNVSVQSFSELQSETNNFSIKSKTISNYIDEECDFFILSLDADALDGSIMEAVSAVNGLGLPLAFVHEIVSSVASLEKPTAFGVYEYNPLFDNLSCKGARAIAALLYNYLK